MSTMKSSAVTSTTTPPPDREAPPAGLRRYADGQLTAVILGFFGAAWFGWAHERPPTGWTVPLTVASVLCLLVALLAAVRLWPVRSALSSRDRTRSRRYGIVVGTSYAIILVGNLVLMWTGHEAYMAAWVSFGIGAHFWALLPVLKDRLLIPLGAVVVVVAGWAVPLSWATDLLPSFIAGAGSGAALLVVALLEMLRRKSTAATASGAEAAAAPLP